MTAKSINVRLPEALYKQIDALANATARNLAIDALTIDVQIDAWQVRDIEAGIQVADAGECATDRLVNVVFSKYGA